MRFNTHLVVAARERRADLLRRLRRSTSAVRARLPKIQDVNVIDKYSRLVFPVSFLLFNVAYWSFYVV